jgi:hypothetical protein
VNPALPDWLPELTLTNLRAGRGSLSLHLRDGAVEAHQNSSGYRVIRGPAPRPDSEPVRARSRRRTAEKADAAT